jgi:hypothetical protein
VTRVSTPKVTQTNLNLNPTVSITTKQPSLALLPPSFSQMYTIYKSSPRQSPRRVRPTIDPNSNILKPKRPSPIQKAKTSQSSKTKPLSSIKASTKTTGNEKPRKVVRKRKVNTEDKENCNTVPRPMRTGGLGVNGSMPLGKKTQPLSLKEIPGRLPLKELPLNGFLDRLKKCDGASSVEIVVIQIG